MTIKEFTQKCRELQGKYREAMGEPMAFNLFCPFIRMLKEGKRELVTRIFQSIFPDKHDTQDRYV